MKHTIELFPFGACQGLLALRLDFEGQPLDADQAERALAIGLASGVWAVWLDNVPTYDSIELQRWVGHQADYLTFVAIRKASDRDWLGYGIDWIVDASEALEHADSMEAFTAWLARNAMSVPSPDDVFVKLAGEPPAPDRLDAIAGYLAPERACFLVLKHGSPWVLPTMRVMQLAKSRWCLRFG